MTLSRLLRDLDVNESLSRPLEYAKKTHAQRAGARARAKRTNQQTKDAADAKGLLEFYKWQMTTRRPLIDEQNQPLSVEARVKLYRSTAKLSRRAKERISALLGAGRILPQK